MPEITLKARIQNKYESLEEWERIGEGQFIPLKGEVCYAVDNGLVYQKIGDGITDFTKLPWLLNQGDNSVNDENSPAYIKNRLGYEYYEDINSDLQTLLNQNNFTAEVFTKAEAEDSLGVTLNINFESIVNAIGEFELTATQVKNINSNGVYQFILNNNTTPYQFDIKNLIPSLQNELFATENIAYYCYGNSYIADLIVASRDGIEIGTIFDPSINTLDDYAIIFMYQYEEENGYLNVIFVGNADVYIPITIDADEKIYGFLGDMNYLQALEIKTIDEKYLGNIQTDNNQVNSSNLSYIKNHYGIHGWTELEEPSVLEEELITSITLSPELFGWNGVSSEIVTSYLDEEYYDWPTFEITVDDTVYNNCPSFYFNSTNKGEDFIFIGNPKYISDFWAVYMSTVTSSEESYYNNYKIAQFDDNDLPFCFLIKTTSETPFKSAHMVKFVGYNEGSTIAITIRPQRAQVIINPIPKYLLPEDKVIGELNESLNSILFNSAYTASGANSIAAGTGTTASGAQTIAIGNSTKASGDNSLAGGNNTVARGANSVSLGENTQATGGSALAMGDEISATITCTRPSIYSATFTAYSDISECGYTHCSFDSGATWLAITSISFAGDKCTIKWSITNIDLAQTTVYLRKNTIASGLNAIALSSGNVSKNISSLVAGTGNTSGANNQTVIGKYNEVDANAAFIIGNGGTRLGSSNSSYHNLSRSNALTVDWEGNVTASGDLIGKSLAFNSELSVLGTDKHLDLSTTKTSEVIVQIQSSSSSDTDLSIYQGEIHNKNWWPIYGWENTTHNGGTEEILEDGSYKLTYTNGSTIIFNIDGSISLDYIAGDTITITRASSRNGIYLPTGNFILSNGIDTNCGVKLYFVSTSYETEGGTLPGISPICTRSGSKIALGVRTVSGTESFSTTFYPQLEMVDEGIINRSGYVIPQVDSFYFDINGTYTLNTTKYLASWEKPYFIFPDTSSTRSIKGYYFNDINKIPYIDSIVSQGRKEKRYIIDLTNLGEYDSFNANTSSENASLELKIRLGEKNSDTGLWTSYYNNITSEQLAIVDLYSDAFENCVEEYLNGYKLSNGYLINTSDIWSINAEGFKDLLTNSPDALFESGSVRLRKNIINNVEYCELYYNIYFYSASDEIKKMLNMIVMADKFITFLPEGYENIYVN